MRARRRGDDTSYSFSCVTDQGFEPLARSRASTMLGARHWARKTVRALRRLLGCSLAHGVAPSDDEISDDGVVRGVNPRQVRSRLLLVAATAGLAPADAALSWA